MRLLSEVVAKFLEARTLKGCLPNTLSYYHYTFRLLVCGIHDIPIEHVTVDDLTAYFAAMRAQTSGTVSGVMSPVTVKKRMLATRALFHFALERGYVARDVSLLLALPASGKRKPKALTTAQLLQLLDTSRWTVDEYAVRDYALLLLFVDSGIRLAELAALTMDDVNVETCEVHVRHGKGDKERSSVFTALTARALTAYRPPFRKNDGLFVDVHGDRVTRRQVYLAVKGRAEQTGLLQVVSPHRLRHTMAVGYLNNGGRIHILQMLLGHESIMTTMVYATVALAGVQRDHMLYSPLRALS